MRGVRVSFVAGVRRDQDHFYIEGRGAVPVTPALWALFADCKGAAFATLSHPAPAPVPAEQRGRVLARTCRAPGRWWCSLRAHSGRWPCTGGGVYMAVRVCTGHRSSRSGRAGCRWAPGKSEVGHAGHRSRRAIEPGHRGGEGAAACARTAGTVPERAGLSWGEG